MQGTFSLHESFRIHIRLCIQQAIILQVKFSAPDTLLSELSKVCKPGCVSSRPAPYGTTALLVSASLLYYIGLLFKVCY